MKTGIKNVTILTPSGELKAGSILLEGERIKNVLFSGEITECDKMIDGKGFLLLPGMIDIHTHGRVGSDFCFADEEALSRMERSYLLSGVTTVFPTIASAEYEDIIKALRQIRLYSEQTSLKAFKGIHLEARYLSPKKRGAHKTELLAPLDPNELDEIAAEMPEKWRISAAFELDSDGAFAKKCRSLGASMSLGHTCATFSEAQACEERGVISYTHLPNAMEQIHHRDGGAVLAALLGDSFCEVICDGIHVSPEFVRLIYKCTGTERLVLVSDSMEATACPDGEYSIAGMPVTVKEGIARTHDGALAGSTLSLLDGVRRLSEYCDIPFEKAYCCASLAPAKLMGMDDIGEIESGKYADLLLLDPNGYKIMSVFKRGRQIV